jgi:hypothetical protein
MCATESKAIRLPKKTAPTEGKADEYGDKNETYQSPNLEEVRSRPK